MSADYDLEALDEAAKLALKMELDRLRSQCHIQYTLIEKYMFQDGTEARIAFSNALLNLKYYRNAYFKQIKHIESWEEL